jgi:hypothetical protein
MHPRGISDALCTPHDEGPYVYIRNHTGSGAGNRKPEKPGCPSSEGVRWRPDLTDDQIVLPRRIRAYTANELSLANFGEFTFYALR